MNNDWNYILDNDEEYFGGPPESGRYDVLYSDGTVGIADFFLDKEAEAVKDPEGWLRWDDVLGNAPNPRGLLPDGTKLVQFDEWPVAWREQKG